MSNVKESIWIILDIDFFRWLTLISWKLIMKFVFASETDIHWNLCAIMKLFDTNLNINMVIVLIT